MRRSRLAVALLGFWTTIAFGPMMAAQQTMNNDAVIKLIKAGLSDDLIVNTINGSPGKYDTSANGLMALRNAGADSKVISAVLLKASPNPPPAPAALPSVADAQAKAAAAVSNIPAGVNGVGVYYQALNGKWQKVATETVTRKTGGVLKSVATEGKLKGNVNATVQEASSKLAVALPASFILDVPEGATPSEYLLLRFHAHEKDREFRLQTGGELHRSDTEAKDSVLFDSKEITPRVYRVTLGSELGKGEYGFLAPNDAGDLASSAGQGKIYTFSVVE